MRPPRFAAKLFILIIAIAGFGAVVWAQGSSVPASALAAATDAESNAVRLLVGRSTVLDVGAPIARVSLTSPDVADALVTSPSQLLINGKLPGTVSMFVWDRTGALKRFEIVVQRDLARLSEQMKQLFPGEQIEVQSNGKNVVLSGTVSNKDVIERAVSVAAGYVDKKEEVVPLLVLQADAPSNQVLLRVRFAEVSRSALTQLGLNGVTGPGGVNGQGTVATFSTGQNPLPAYDDFVKGNAGSGDGPTKQTFSDLLNLFLFNNKANIGAVISAMQQKGLFQSLAEPNLVAESGKEASFLAGGEFPVPIAQGSGGAIAITVQYKEFGIRLSFTPIVQGTRVHLKVRPEVSTLDFANAITLNGFRIPALSTRRTETELELENHQTFAIAGLLSNTANSTLQKIPGIGDIPVLGALFRSKQAQKDQTELVVMITPEILPNNSPGAASSLPRTPEPFMPPQSEKTSVPPLPPVSERMPNAPAAALAATIQGAPKLDRPQTAPLPPPAPVPAAAAVAAASSNPEPTSTRPLTDKEQKTLAQARKQEADRAAELAKAQAKSDAKAKEDEDKRQKKLAEDAAKQHEIDVKKAAQDRKKQDQQSQQNNQQ
ncbi:MAG TPA: pilus assembly protein N-terminal domain-containing protein [Vicinamibacterales bacterium]|jgi:pilus assembly protein CpaC|nr:pilus assembly protein N-terminal domain-containing protein [Vicinamibacterales bacterium]